MCLVCSRHSKLLSVAGRERMPGSVRGKVRGIMGWLIYSSLSGIANCTFHTQNWNYNAECLKLGSDFQRAGVLDKQMPHGESFYLLPKPDGSENPSSVVSLPRWARTLVQAVIHFSKNIPLLGKLLVPSRDTCETLVSAGIEANSYPISHRLLALSNS